MKISKKFFLLFVIILIIGVVRNLYYTWKLSGYLDGDCATVVLMTDDILHGRFNTFFYGQDYGGTFDSFWLVPFVYIFGLKVFIVLLGIIAQYMVYLFTVYKLGTLIKNSYVGILAFTYCAIAPYPLLNSSVFPYGYHINIMILGNLILIFTLLIDKRGNSIWTWILLGLCAGLGFWDHYIILYYLVPSVVFLLIPLLRARAGLIKETFKRFKYYFWAIIAFFIGSLPFWKYNIQSGFPSLTSRYRKVYVYEESFNTSFWPTVKKLFGYHIQGLLGAGRINMPAFIIWGIFIIAFAVFCMRLNRKKLLLILFLCSFFGFSLSHGYFVMADKYYFFLPLYTFISICFGYFIYWVYGNKRYLGVGLYLFVLLFNFRDFTLSTYNWRPDKKDIEVYNYRDAAYKGLIEFLCINRIDAVISDFVTVQGINFITNKRILGAEFRDGRVPIDESAQARDRLALIERSGEIKYSDYLISTLDIICKSYKTAHLFDYKIIYDFNKYGYCGKSIDKKDWKAYANYNGGDALYSFDRNLDKYWSSKKDKNPDMYYDLDLGKEYNVYKLIVVNKMPLLDNLPSGYKIEVSCDGKRWDLVKESYGPEPLFWSGPRIYWDYKNGRWEVIFKPVKARYIRIKNTDFGRHTWIINELYAYEYLGEKEPKVRDYVKAAKVVYNYLVSKDIKFAYADYWLSAKIKEWSNDRINSLSIINECYPRRRHTSRLIGLNKDTVIIVDKENANEVSKILREFDLPIDKIDFGLFTPLEVVPQSGTLLLTGFICYKFEKINKWQRYFLSNQKCLYWTGVSIVKVNPRIFSFLLAKYGTELEKRGELISAFNYYKKAFSVFPRNNIACERLVELYKVQGLYREAEKQLLKLKHLCCPKTINRIIFKNGVIFYGYSLLQYRNRIYIDYYWHLPKEVPKGISVFVHFVKDGKIIFQNDHDFLYAFSKPVTPLQGMFFVERECVDLPSGVNHGHYDIQLGLYRVNTGKRIRIKGAREARAAIGTMNME